MSTQGVPATEQVRDAWDAVAPGFDEFTTPVTMAFGEEILSRIDISPGTRVLDVAAGSGALAIPAARRGANVVGVDISPAMIERLRARARAEGLSNLEVLVMDGHALELEDATFDIAVSLNGVTVFPDLTHGLAELVRVTRPGGRVLVAAFGPMPKQEFIMFFMGALQATVPGFAPPTDPPPLPFQVADPGVLRARLTEAGLHDVHVETIRWDMAFDSAQQLWGAASSGHPIAAQAIADTTDEQRAAAQAVLAGMLRERSGGTSRAVLHNEANIGVGRVGG
jgi:ubiquinone/menaquinone biosynthesis C-methylase UbiE